MLCIKLPITLKSPESISVNSLILGENQYDTAVPVDGLSRRHQNYTTLVLIAKCFA